MARASDSNIFLAVLRDKTFQASEIRRVIKLSFVYLLITTVLLGLFYHHMLGDLVRGSAPLLFASEDLALINEVVPSMTAVLGRWLIAMMIINVVLTIALGVFITRRLGHPLMAIRRALREVACGNLDVRLRESDSGDFGELTHELNAALCVVRDQVAKAKASLGDDQDKAKDDAKQALDYFQVHSANSASADDSNAA